MKQDLSRLFNIQHPKLKEMSDHLHISAEKNEYIPEIIENYHFDEPTTLALLAGFAYNKRVLVQGYHGSGKSSHIEQVAARLNWPCIRINFDGNISRIDLVGRDAIILKDGKQITEFRDGIIPWALKQPIAIVMDEYDAARADVLFVIQRLLESEGNFTLIDQNIVIKQHPLFRIFATSNTVGLGDITGLYTGTNILNQGQLDRWNIIANLNYLPEDIETKIVASKIKKPNLAIIRQMVMIANLTRNGFASGDLSCLMSPRTVISWAELYDIFDDLELSFRLSFMNKCDESEKSVIAEYFQRIFDIELKEFVSSYL